ncbi:DUF4169 family protein [Falsirhodobacter sp. alg1]|uniref:DUF4169 family protein n=1 Tax=Falsirhodobacter sp. alg1 TaxID=1472418 RepID=UPI0008325921|nr:DUF4169 family protein [Falsirhodobacter sp. alg1]
MTNIVNLRTARKARDTAKARAQADANATKFGRTKAERLRQQAEADKADRTLDSHKKE